MVAGPAGRRARLLASLLLFLLLLLFASLMLVLLVAPQQGSRRDEYAVLIGGLSALVALAYGLNRGGRYLASAVVIVACSVLGPWGSLLLDPGILEGDLVPLVWVALSVLLSSVLLPPAFTIVLAALQSAGLGLLFALSPATSGANWPSMLAYVLASSALCILAGVVSQRDAAQIDHQTDLLVASETRLRDQSVRDHLTGLFNRRYLEETLERELARSARERRPLGLIMLDIDHFKDFNDALGHAAGDALLEALGALLRAHVRGSDVVCRYGGEEFLLVLPDASGAIAAQRAEQLRDDVSRMRVAHGDQDLGSVTVSLGVAVFPEHGPTGDAVLKAADAALYRAKDEGRDRVVVADM